MRNSFHSRDEQTTLFSVGEHSGYNSITDSVSVRGAIVFPSKEMHQMSDDVMSCPSSTSFMKTIHLPSRLHVGALRRPNRASTFPSRSQIKVPASISYATILPPSGES